MGGHNDQAYEPKDTVLSPCSLAVCLVSGGMDSCVTAAIADEENEELAFLHVSYGQRTEARERQAFNELADHFGVTNRLAVSIEHLRQIGGSSLTDPNIAITEIGRASCRERVCN